MHLEIPHESHGFETQFVGAKRSTFLDPHCSELVDSHELFILCDIMGKRTAHLVDKLGKKKTSKYVTDAPEGYILGGIHLYIQTIHTFPHSHNPILTVIMV